MENTYVCACVCAAASDYGQLHVSMIFLFIYTEVFSALWNCFVAVFRALFFFFL